MKSILVHLDASPRSAIRLAIGQSLARRHGAELSVLYGVVPSMLACTWGAAEGMAVAAPMFADIDREQLSRARSTFEAAAVPGERMTWIDGGSTPHLSLTRRAPYADLIVVGQFDSRDPLTGGLPPEHVSATITDTGKPTLIVPCEGAVDDAQPRRIVVGWKPTREAARAVACGLPWLRGATDVHIGSRQEEDSSGPDDAASLKHWLQLHGVTARLHTHPLDSGDAGVRLLALAAHTGADMLVMGCYGHSRAREWVLGGASHTVLNAMSLPVLMAH